MHLTVKTQPCHAQRKPNRSHIAHVQPGLNPGYAVHGPIITQDVRTQQKTHVQCAQVRIRPKAGPKVRVKQGWIVRLGKREH